jgi:Arc/MetJ-type ribon-helix-helix transcriptional regulator
MSQIPTVSIQTDIPAELFSQLEKLVASGWYRSVDDALQDALRRFLDSHRTELMEEFVHQDVRWGLSGDE